MQDRQDLIVLFGSPASGKTTIGNELIKFGYYFYDSDIDILPEARALNEKGLSLTEEIRKKQHEVIFSKIERLMKQYSKLVVARDFMWDRYRLLMKKRFPGFRWVKINCPRNLIEVRAIRPNHLISQDFALRIYDRFETHSFVVQEVDNSHSLSVAVRKILEGAE